MKLNFLSSLDRLAQLALLPAWLGLLGGWFWFFDLFANFRWQYLVVAVGAAGWALWRRRRWLLLAAVLTLLLNAALIGRLARHADIDRAVLADDFALHVVSLNVLQPNRHRQEVLDYLLASDADVIFLTEVDRKWVAAMQPLAAKYPYHLAEPHGNFTGVAMFSRIPWQQAGILRFGAPGIPSIEARMSWQGRNFTIIGTHPLSPSNPARAHLRDGQFAFLAEHVRQSGEPVIVVGDFNATPWSAGMRIATARNLGFRSRGAPWTPTWRVRSIMAIPIDHALCTAPLVVARRAVGPDVGSDHRPLQLTFGWIK